LKIAESNIKAAVAGKTHKCPFDNFVSDESDCEDDKTDEAAAAAIGCRKRSRRGDVIIIIINDIVKRRAQPPRSVRQTREAQQPASRSHIPCAAARLWPMAGGRPYGFWLRYEVIVRKYRETRTLSQYGADLDPKLLKGFKAGQRSRRHKARSTPRG